MLNRYGYEIVGEVDGGYYVVKDYLSGDKLILSKNEEECKDIVDILNRQYIDNNYLNNELDRVHECFIDLDILIGTLSWYLDESYDEYEDMDRLKKLSESLSKTITKAMYPQISKRFEEEG